MSHLQASDKLDDILSRPFSYSNQVCRTTEMVKICGTLGYEDQSLGSTLPAVPLLNNRRYCENHNTAMLQGEQQKKDFTE